MQIDKILVNFGMLLDDGLLVLTSGGGIAYANEAAEELLGANLVARKAEDVFGSKVGEHIKTALGGEICEYTADEGDGLHLRLRFCQIDKSSIAVLLLNITRQHNLEKVRRDFIANVSHELRSPLTSLIGFIETMQDSANLDEATQQRFLHIMDEEAGRMARLIDDLMSLSRVEIDGSVAPKDKIYIKQLVQSVIASLANRAEKEGHSILFNDARAICDDSTTIIGVADEIKEVFHNLLDNAIKYSTPATDIEVVMRENRAEGLGGGLCFDVINMGDGIGAEHISRLTERFYRIDKGRSRKMGGTGLGLAIVKHIVNHHGGRLNIASKPMAETVFSVELPVSKDGG